MQTSEEPFLPFSNNLSYKRIRFDDKLDVIRKIILIDQKTCFLVDANHNIHLKTFLKEDEKAASLQFPLPPYARNINPRVLYSVDYYDLYRYLYQKKPPADREERDEKYIQFCYLGDYQLAVQLDKSNPVAILDLQRSKTPPKILEDVFGVQSLISVGNACLAWYEEATGLVILNHYISRKRKVLNFAKLGIEKLHCLKDHVIVAVAEDSFEVLDYVRNKLIKSVYFTNGCINNNSTPGFAVHSEGNIISYITERYIHVLKTDKGKIEWESHHESENENNYVFIANNLIAMFHADRVQIFQLDSQNFSLLKKIESPQLGFSDALKVRARCCERSLERSLISSIFPLGEHSFGILEILCRYDYDTHGYQRLTQFSLKDLRVEDGVDMIKFELRKSLLFEEYRDSVRAIDVLDESVAMFITERGRIFKANLKNYSAEYITELDGLIGLLKPKKPSEIRQIDKFFALAENKVAVSTRIGSSRSARIAVISLSTRSTDWNSTFLRDEEDTDLEDDEYVFYDMVKLDSNKILLSYKDYDGEEYLYKIGQLSPRQELNGLLISDYGVQQRTEVLFDKLWNIEGHSLVVMRHGEQISHLSFLDLTQNRIVQELDVGTYFSNSSNHNVGIYDAKLISKNVISISVKNTKFVSFQNLVYNIQTGELLNKIQTYEHSILGTIRQCYRENNIMQNMSKMVVFGGYGGYKLGIGTKPLQDLISKKTETVHISTQFDFQPNINSRNWKQLKGGAIISENRCQRNFVCILKAPNFKVEGMRILQKAIGDVYHKYIYKDVVDMIFGIQQ